VEGTWREGAPPRPRPPLREVARAGFRAREEKHGEEQGGEKPGGEKRGGERKEKKGKKKKKNEERGGWLNKI
jgi:hypothetical protein